MRSSRAALIGVLACTALRAEPLRLIDDRGEPIKTDLEVCFQVGTRNDCSVTRQGYWNDFPAGWTAIRVEGPDHGPAWRAREGVKDALVVPRKAELQVSAGQEKKVTVSVYPQNDPSFRSPVFRSDISLGQILKIPSGDPLISLVAPGRAPDLHLLHVEPASRLRLSYTARSGWSLVTRCLAEKTATPVAEAKVRLQGTEGFSKAGEREVEASTIKSGLAVFSGIPHALASLNISHPGFVPGRQEGLSASPGTFAFREVRLEEGGTLKATVTTDGHPAREAVCQILEYDQNPIGPAQEPRIHSRSNTDSAGVCRSSKLAAGPYTLRLRIGGNRSFVDRSVILANGQETEATVALASIRVSGTVRKGEKPAPAYVVTFFDQDEVQPNATRRDAQGEGVTDDEGEYEALLWSEGDYLAKLITPGGTPASLRRVRLGAGEETVDFHLLDQAVEGRVVDDRDRPVEGAGVMLGWNREYRVAKSGADGSFIFPMVEAGLIRVQTQKPGYVAPPPFETLLPAEGPFPPITLRLKRAGLLSGRLLSGIGPAAGAGLMSYRVEPGGRATYLGEAVADAEGHFEVAGADGGTTRLFVTGSGCPLVSFDLQPSSEDLTLRCPDQPASLEVHFEDSQGRPAAGRSIFARRDGVIVPAEVLIRHLGRFHLPAAADGAGRLFLVALAPGGYDLFLADATSPDLVATGSVQGFVASASLAPATTTELAVTLESTP